LGESARVRKSFRGLTQFQRLVIWAVTLNVAAVLLAIGFHLDGMSPSTWWAVLGLALVAAIAERQSVRVAGNVEVSVSFLPFVFAAVAFGPFAALLVGAIGNIGIFPALLPRNEQGPYPYLKWAVYTPARAITGAVAGLAALAVQPADQTSFAVILLAVLAASTANLLTDALLNIATLWVRGTGNYRSFLVIVGPFLLIAVPLYVPLLALLVYGYRVYSFWVVAIFLVTALALQRVVHLYQEQRDAVSSLAEANSRLERANLSFAGALVAALDARDEYTAGHSAAVAIYARDIAARMGLSEAQQQMAHVAGLVHDIGKIGLPAGLLEKPGALTLEERRLMERHSEIGERILARVDDYAEIAAIVRHHHERFDGNGYPDGIDGEAIPIIARVIAVADAYNAMTSDRPYREAMPTRVARLRLAQAVETQFDTAVVAAFEAILAGASESYRLATRVDFEFDGQANVLEGSEAPVFTPDLLTPRIAIRAVGA
jgi:putative nucleotidyltransferase with HDIG domain